MTNAAYHPGLSVGMIFGGTVSLTFRTVGVNGFGLIPLL